MMVRRTRNSLTRRDSVASPTVTSPSPLPLLPSPFPLPSLLSLFRPVHRKKRSRPSSFHETSSQVALRRNDTMTLPAVTCEWPSRVLCRPIARDTWTPLGLPSSPPPRGHPEGILDLASAARRGGSVDTITSSFSCYGRPMVDSRMDTMLHKFFVSRFFLTIAYNIVLSGFSIQKVLTRLFR